MVLMIFDGFGFAPDSPHNAITKARTPCLDQLYSQCPMATLSGSGNDVGLPAGQMGNSEVGHLTLGSGRVIYQDLSRITRSIKHGDFFHNKTLCEAVDHGNAVHVMGLLSPGGVHSHEDHLFAMIRLAHMRGAKKIYLHAFLDGRDTSPKSAMESLQKAQALFDELGVGCIASISGRYYAMDRDARWDRTERVYQLLVDGEVGYHADSATAALQAAYDRNETDEFVQPTLLSGGASIQSGDAVIFMNFRSDRARQLTQALTSNHFNSFLRSRLPSIHFVSLTQYDATFDVPVAFLPVQLENVLGDYLSQLGKTQLRIAETEKYAHVTFFFNGGREEPFPHEERILIPSPKVTTYDLQPEMSANQLTDRLVQCIESKKYDVIICNYANADMVGHTGNFDATVKAVECLDHCLQRVINALQNVGGELLLTADHGNADCMFNDDNHQPHTAHTSNVVPFVYFGRSAHVVKKEGSLSDVAPTLLSLMQLPIPDEMSGTPLMELE